MMRRIATEREYALSLTDHQALMELYREDLRPVRPVLMDALTVVDELDPTMQLVSGSVQPAFSSINGQRMEWQWPASISSTQRITITYQVEPLSAGVHPVSTLAEIQWTDTEGRAGTAAFPNVDLEVLVPPPTVEPPTATNTRVPSTATPTSTIRPTDNPTPVPEDLYLPYLVKSWPEPTATVPPSPTPPCVPSSQAVDVAIILDTSTSMSENTRPGGTNKLDAAIDAAKALVGLLKLPDADQATVIWFNTSSAVAAPLTSDAQALLDALDTLPGTQASGTRIELGLADGLAELSSARHRPASNRAMILVSDGKVGETSVDAVLAAAGQVKAAGIVLWTVGLGVDADQALLRQAASTPAQFRYAPDTDSLRLLYEEIARVIPCR
jgi:hypothetical protein